MTVELLQTLSIASFILAGVMILIAIALFFLLDVPKLYGDISGRAAQKAIEEIRRHNEETGNKAYKPSPVNAARGKLTDKITMSGRVVSQTEGLSIAVGTEKFPTATLVSPSNETTLLDGTMVETTFIGYHPNAEATTCVLPEISNDTQSQRATQNFTIDVEMGFYGSSEIIE